MSITSSSQFATANLARFARRTSGPVYGSPARRRSDALKPDPSNLEPQTSNLNLESQLQNEPKFTPSAILFQAVIFTKPPS
jgi:hypothetical protein